LTIQPLLLSNYHDGLKFTLSKIEHFKSLPIEAQKSIIEVAIPRQYKAGQVIYLEGEPADYVYILERVG
jgi:CRP-like cAMP-binding protein